MASWDHLNNELNLMAKTTATYILEQSNTANNLSSRLGLLFKCEPDTEHS